jgi:hypothetical protein
MNRQEIATLSLHLAALYAWFSALELVSSGALMILFMTASASSSVSPIAAFGYAIPPLIFAAIGTFLFLRAPHLAHHFLERPNEPIQSAATSIPASLAFGVVGLVGVVYWLPRVAQILIYLFQSDQFRSPTAKDVFLRELPSIAASILQFALCLALVTYARSFAAWWERRQKERA